MIVTTYDPDSTIPRAYVSALVVLVEFLVNANVFWNIILNEPKLSLTSLTLCEEAK